MDADLGSLCGPQNHLFHIISKMNKNFSMSFDMCLDHLNIFHFPKFHQIWLISNYVIHGKLSIFILNPSWKVRGVHADPRARKEEKIPPANTGLAASSPLLYSFKLTLHVQTIQRGT